MADPERLLILGVDAWNKWRKQSMARSTAAMRRGSVILLISPLAGDIAPAMQWRTAQCCDDRTYRPIARVLMSSAFSSAM